MAIYQWKIYRLAQFEFYIVCECVISNGDSFLNVAFLESLGMYVIHRKYFVYYLYDCSIFFHISARSVHTWPSKNQTRTNKFPQTGITVSIIYLLYYGNSFWLFSDVLHRHTLANNVIVITLFSHNFQLVNKSEISNPPGHCTPSGRKYTIDLC